MRDARRREQRAQVGGNLFHPARRYAVDLVDDGDAALDREQLDDAQVLDRLRHDAIVRGDDEQDCVDAAYPGEHVAHKALVPRHVDKSDQRVLRRAPVGEAQIDGDAAALLLRQPVGVDAGQRTHQRSLAVIDVAGGGNDHLGKA